MPQQFCIVPGCTERGNHYFPKDREQCWRWTKAIREAYPATHNDWEPRPLDVICYRHFKPSCYRSTLLAERRRLVGNSVPSIFETKPSYNSYVSHVRKVELPIACALPPEIISLRESAPKQELIVNTKASSQRVTIFQGENHPANLCKVLNDLRLQGICCDVSLKLPFQATAVRQSNTVLYKAHSAVLSARSRFFKNIFTQNANQSNVTVTLPNFINPKAMEIVLHYIYTGRLGIRMDTVSPIYQVGWLFQMDDILMLCGQFCKMKNFKPSPVEVMQMDLSSCTPTDKTANSAADDSAIIEINGEADLIKCEAILNEDGADDIPDDKDIEEQSTEQITHITEAVDYEAKESEISVIVKDMPGNDVQLAEGPPEMIECTPIILGDNFDDNADLPDKEVTVMDTTVVQRAALLGPNNYRCEKKLIIFKPRHYAQGQLLQDEDDLPRPLNENYAEDAELIVIPIRSNYPSPVLHVLDGVRMYLDVLVKYGFFHIEFHVDSSCRKGVVKTDGKLVCIMFGQVNHFFPITHTITAEDVERFRLEEEMQINSMAAKSTGPIKMPPKDAEDWDPIFGRDGDSEKDVLHCFSCSCVFFTIQSKASHLLRHHRNMLHWERPLNLYKYKCGACDFKCSNLRRLYFHRHQNHAWQLPEVILQFRCGLCSASEFSINTARDHLLNVHNISDKVIYESLRMGNRVVNNPRRVSLLGLTRTIKRKDVEYQDDDDDSDYPAPKEYRFECRHCKKPLRSRSLVTLHERTHTGEKPYKCPHCEYASAYAGNLKMHINNKHLKAANGDQKARQRKKRRRRRKNMY